MIVTMINKMKTYWYSVIYKYQVDLHQFYFKLNKYTPPSDGYIPSWQESHDHKNNMHIYENTMGVICRCENCENAMSAVSKIKTRILQGAANTSCNVAFDKSFDKLMCEDVVE